ncbi:MAG: class I SAM-dependent methyltransferase [Actinomycetota bacterium]|nr:class I SAM-dependent methyltransferase [Actinomycetota bacterium]
MPLANAYLRPGQREADEPSYPLRPMVCDNCLLVQLEALVSPEELFGDYAYFSSFSHTWLEHGERFARAAAAQLGLASESLVVEVASNDGYLLQHFMAMGVPVLGIEPAANVAAVARSRGVTTETAMFGLGTAVPLRQRVGRADLVVANNVLAHVPDLHDFVAGLSAILAPSGVLSIEVPHLLCLIEETQFDTIYHEHFSYFSLRAAERALSDHQLAVFDAEQLPTHGGSLRIWAAPVDAGRPVSDRLASVRDLEAQAGLGRIDTYAGFGSRVEACRCGVLDFLADARASGKSVVAYGAAAKGNTLLNYCGVSTDDISYVADRSPEKQGRRLPGSHLPVEPPERIFETRPDYVVILPWNLRDEISRQLAAIDEWGGRFVTFAPQVRVDG